MTETRTTQPETKSETAAMANVYLLLSRLWIAEADELLLQEMGREPIRSCWEAIAGQKLSLQECDLESLACEFCRIFVGPKEHLPPVQSVWTEDRFRGNSAASMEKYLALLTDFTPPNGVEPDHLGLQLAVMGTMLTAASRLVGETRRQSAFELVDAFYVEHLAWAGPLLATAAGRTQSDFYACMLRVTRELLGSAPTLACSK